MITFPTIGQNVLTNFFMSQISLGYIVYKAVSVSWTTCYNFVGKLILILRAFLRVKCGK